MPTLLIGGASLPVKPLLALVALYAALWLGASRAAAQGIDGDHVWNAGLLAAAAALAAARLWYVAQFWSIYLQEPLQVFSLRPGTLAWMPGILIGLLAGLVTVARSGLSFGALADAMAPGALLGLAILSLADFLAGDAYGAPTALPWAISLWGASRHPVQLYEAVVLLLALGLVWRVQGSWPGQIAWLSLFLYASSRLFLDAFRGDSLVLAGGYRAEQLAALAAGLFSVWVLTRPKRRVEVAPD